MREKTLWIKDDYLAHILSGRKNVEIRIGYSNITRLQVGDCLLLNDRYPYTIERIDHYQNFEELLSNEDPSAIAPDMTAADLLNQLRKIYPAEKESLGVIALEILPTK
jgi:ASC-1-like (ASCH) protein